MPGTYRGNASKNSSATAWAASQVRALGSLCTPSFPNGLVFICTAAGTTAGPEPSWDTPPYPTIGTVFTDGGLVQWTTYSNQPGPFPIVLQQAVDADPPIAYGWVLPMQWLADEAAWLGANMGLLGYNNTWTGIQTFTSYNYDTPVFVGTVNPGSGYVLVDKLAVSGSVNGRMYMGTGQFAWTVNAAWTGSQWEYDASADAASLMVFTNNGWQLYSYAASQTSPWGSGEWVLQASVDMTGATNSLTNNLTVTDGNIYASAGSVTASETVNAGTDLTVGGKMATNNNLTTAGQWGCGTVLRSTNAIGLGSSPTDVLATYSVPKSGFYEIKVFIYGGSGNVAASTVTVALTAPGFTGANPLLGEGGFNCPCDWYDTNADVMGLTIQFYATASGSVRLNLSLATGTASAAAVLVALA